MRKRGIIFSSIFACILMLLASNISAIEFITVKENITDCNEYDLIDALIERIEQLEIQNPNPKLTLNGDDPDGPYEGGLDDPQDWMDLFVAFIFGFNLALYLKIHALKKAFERGNIFIITIRLIRYGLYTAWTLNGLIDAFDISDPDEDGY